MCRHYRVYARIDLDAILHNMEAIHQKIKKDTKIMAVVKADGYGHGAVRIAETLEELPYLYGFAVATVEEGCILREHGIRKPILILGYVFPEQYGAMLDASLLPAVFSEESARGISRAAGEKNKDCPIHFAVDTGMSRIGYQVTKDAADEMVRIAKLPHIMAEGVFTHFARADEADKSHTFTQLRQFQTMISMLKQRGLTIPLCHCSNSAGIVELPEANMDLVRAGIILYGLWPSDETDKSRIDLKPVMEIKARISYVKELPKGRAISYGGTYVTKKPCVIATIPVGYADGYARGLSGKGEVLIAGKRAPIRGRICMDQFMVDVTEIPGVKAGDEVTLIGKDGGESITMEDVGTLSGRFNYEFVCDIGKRVPRVFVRDGVTFE